MISATFEVTKLYPRLISGNKPFRRRRAFFQARSILIFIAGRCALCKTVFGICIFNLLIPIEAATLTGSIFIHKLRRPARVVAV